MVSHPPQRLPEVNLQPRQMRYLACQILDETNRKEAIEPDLCPESVFPTWGFHPELFRDNAALAGFLKETGKRRSIKKKDGFKPEFRRALASAHGGRCAYCGEPLGQRFHVDHIIPRHLGGGCEPGNLVAACWSCNSAKRHRPMTYLRFALALRQSKLQGIVTPLQAIGLIQQGVNLGIYPVSFFAETQGVS